jgi:hypothetical protein
MDRAGVERAVVDIEVPCVIVLLHQEHRRGERRCTRADDALLEHVMALPFQFILYQLRLTIGLAGHERHVGEEMNVVIVVAWRWQAD